MKKMFAAMLLMFALIPSTWAQEQGKNVTDLKAEIASLQSKLDDQQKQEKFTSQFVGFGKELGTAMNGFVEAMDGGMKVTTDRVNEFAKTEVGRYAIIAIGWKIFSADIIAISSSIFSKLTGFVFLLVFCWLLKRTLETLCWGKMIVTKRDGPWYARVKTKERTVPLIKDESADDNGVTTYLIISCLAMVIMLISACVCFA